MFFPSVIGLSRTDGKRKQRRRGKPVFGRNRRHESLESRELLSAVTWSVLSDTTGSSPGDPYSIRGLALSSDDASIYAGYIHSDAINQISTSTGAVEASVSTAVGSLQPKGIATDDRGYVYATLSSNGNSQPTQQWAIYNSDLTPVANSPFTSATTSPKQLAGMAVQKLNGHYYLYISSNMGAATIERWNVDNPTSPVLDTSWGNSGVIDLKAAPYNLGSNAFLNGLTVDTDGTIYATGGVNSTDRGDAVFKISADGQSLLDQASVSGAMDDAIYAGKLFVTDYLGPNSEITVLNEADLSTFDTITDSPKGSYTGVTPDARGYDAGYSGIDISANGQIYVGEQLYAITSGQFHDRILVSSPLVAPSFTSANNTSIPVSTAGNFTFTTAGSPTPTSVTETGSLPSGLTFTDNGNGTATLTGTPAAGTGGVYQLTVTAHNYLGDTSQLFTLTVAAAPQFTGTASTTFTEGTAGTFNVTTTGGPLPALTETGALPGGVTFVDNGNGTATLSGTPAAGSAGTYPLTIKASNGISPDATQNFVLTVNAAPAITSAATTTFVTGFSGTFTVTATGSPTPALTETGALPGGLTFVDNGNGTATLSGTPAANSAGSYPISIQAANGVAPDATQSFTLTISAAAAPAITSANSANFAEGSPNAFTFTATGTPTAGFTESGSLPSGVTFVDNGNGTATLAGAPAVGTQGNYQLSVTAHNGVQPDDTQTFTLTVSAAVIETEPAITSPSAATFAFGIPTTFTVSTTGSPTPTITETGALPSGLTFVDNGNGTATIAGAPAVGTVGTYQITITAHNGVGNDAVQVFTLTVGNFGYYLAGIPGDSTNQTFVHNLYRELLGREPEAAGFAFWNAYLAGHNTINGREQVVSGFLNSPEYRNHYVTVLYEVLLGRAPEAAGLQFWTDKMGAPGTPGGHTGSADEKYIMAAIIGSDEFYADAGGTSQGFVTALYHDLLNRAPDPAGLAFWADAVNAQPDNRDGIVRSFMSSPEFIYDLLNTFYPATGGTTGHLLPAPGTAVTPPSPVLAVLTGDGWENLYLEGPYGNSSPQGNDAFFAALAAGAPWDDVQLLMLNTNQFYTNPNRPLTLA